MRRGAGSAALAALFILFACGCDWWTVQSVTVTTINDRAEPIHNIEVDYQGGSYGISELAPGQKHVRVVRFRADSQLTYTYLDAAGAKHTFKEGSFRTGSAGTATVHIGPGGQVKFDQVFRE